MTWMQTYTGKHFNLLDPRPDDIDPEDIAHALAHICRFTGHTREFYSVAQHSVLVSRNVPKSLALAGLLHDAHEAYIGDISSPVKAATSDDMDRIFLEDKIKFAIALKFGIDAMWSSIEVDKSTIKTADLRMLMTECRDLMDGERGGDWGIPHEPFDFKIIPWTPDDAKYEFALRLGRLWR